MRKCAAHLRIICAIIRGVIYYLAEFNLQMQQNSD